MRRSSTALPLCAAGAGRAGDGPAARLTIVEGAYARHPALWDSYDLRVFLTVDAAEQLRRIEARSGPEKLQMFRDRWIPLEESYFTAFDLPARCDMALKG